MKVDLKKIYYILEHSFSVLFFFVAEDQDLYPRLDAAFLLRFIRVRKYNVDAAARTVKNYYRNRAVTASTTGSFLPSSIKPHARNLFMVLPERDVQGRLIILCKIGERFVFAFLPSFWTLGFRAVDRHPLTSLRRSHVTAC